MAGCCRQPLQSSTVCMVRLETDLAPCGQPDQSWERKSGWADAATML